MVVNHKKKFVFIHIPKNAGSSMNEALAASGGMLMDDYDWHVPASYASGQFGWFNKYFKFSFVRNPWDRAFSMYRFMMKRGRFPKTTTLEQYLRMDIFTDASRLQFPVVSIIKKPQLDFLTDNKGNIVVDYVGRMETIDQDFQHICDMFGFENKLQKINATPSQKHYREVFDDTTRKLVERYFEKDIDTFKYTF